MSWRSSPFSVLAVPAFPLPAFFLFSLSHGCPGLLSTLARSGGTPEGMDVILDQLAAVIQPVPIWYLWRPRLRDRDDDMVLEAAANAAATHLVTFNSRDFGKAPGHFGIELCRPSDVARILRDESE